MTIRELRVRLAAIENAIDDAIATGASYSNPGSGSVTNHRLAELQTERTRVRRQLLQLQRYSVTRTAPDFSC